MMAETSWQMAERWRCVMSIFLSDGGVSTGSAADGMAARFSILSSSLSVVMKLPPGNDHTLSRMATVRTGIGDHAVTLRRARTVGGATAGTRSNGFFRLRSPRERDNRKQEQGGGT